MYSGVSMLHSMGGKGRKVEGRILQKKLEEKADSAQESVALPELQHMGGGQRS